MFRCNIFFENVSHFLLYLDMIKLYDLNNYKTGVIKSLVLHTKAKLRLSEMGVMPGALIRMIKKTPFGGPIYIKINNYYLSIRKEDALNTMVDIDE